MYSTVTTHLVTVIMMNSEAVTIKQHKQADIPADVLYLIFKDIVDNCKLEEAEHGTGYSFISLGQVCGYWRRILINSPSFWTSIFYDHYSLALLALERSLNSPIDVVFTIRRFQVSANRNFNSATTNY